MAQAELLKGDKYEILEKGKKGGAGEVFRVLDRRLQKVWAAKKIKKGCPGMEALALGRIALDCFPRIVDVVEDEDCRYLIMDWIEGETLQERLKREGFIGEEEAVKLGIALCDALGALHRMQPPILYLDCKPSNIMVDQGGKLRLIDFGSALESAGMDVEPISGSPGYAAPEQLGACGSGRRADVRTDIYGLGRTLYALLSGIDPAKPPFAACPLSACGRELSEGIVQIVERCTRKRPQERFQTMEALKNALEKHAEKGSGIAFKRGLRACVTFFVSGLMLWCAWLFYGALQDPAASVYGKLFSLSRIVLLAAAAYLWQRLAVEKSGRNGWDVEPLLSVQRTEKAEGRWLAGLLVCICILGLWPKEPLTGNGQADRTPFVLRDARMRKLLIKNGSALETKEPVFLEFDPALFETDQRLEICVTVGMRGGRSREYHFLFVPSE